MTNVIEALLYLTCALTTWNFEEFDLSEFDEKVSHHSDYFIDEKYTNTTIKHLQDDIELRQVRDDDTMCSLQTVCHLETFMLKTFNCSLLGQPIDLY